MTIKEQIRREIELRGKLKGSEKMSIKAISKASNLEYTGFLKWYNEDSRGMSDKNIQKVLDVLGKRLVLIDKD